MGGCAEAAIMCLLVGGCENYKDVLVVGLSQIATFQGKKQTRRTFSSALH